MLRSRISRVLSAAFVALAALIVMMGAAPQKAQAGSIYTAAVTAYYQNPITGQVEDSGGAEQMALGQSMVDSVAYPYALLEYDDAGNAFVTLRLQLASHISGEAFDYDSAWSGQFYRASATLVQESSDTADFRFQVDNGSYLPAIRVTMYVADMGRDVVFFVTLGSLTEGNAYGFVESVSTGTATTPDQTTTSSGADAATTTAAPSAAPEATPEATDATQETPAEPATPTATTPEVATPEAETPEAGSGDAQTSDGIAEFDADGNPVDDAGTQSVSVPLAAIVVVGAVVVIAAIGAVVYLVAVRPRRAALADAAFHAATLPVESSAPSAAPQPDAAGASAAASSDADATRVVGTDAAPAESDVDKTIRAPRVGDRPHVD